MPRVSVQPAIQDSFSLELGVQLGDSAQQDYEETQPDQDASQIRSDVYDDQSKEIGQGLKGRQTMSPSFSRIFDGPHIGGHTSLSIPRPPRKSI